MNSQVTTLILAALLLVSCSSGNDQELRAFIESKKTQKGERIEPLPAFPPYVAVTYSAAGSRSPFSPPRIIVTREIKGTQTSAPDTSRPREYLERFNIAELRMVGTIEQNGVRWALISDATGSVNRVKVGNYIGRNYGIIISVKNRNLELIETVVDGQGGWVERPRSLNMSN